MIAPLSGAVVEVAASTMVLVHNPDCRTTYLFGPTGRVWADCTCGEAWRLKGGSAEAAVLLKALHEADPWGARFVQVLSLCEVDWAQPGRETLAFTAYTEDGRMVGLIDPSQQARDWSSVARQWQYGVQVCGPDGDVERTLGQFLNGPTALAMALAEVARLTGNLAVMSHPLALMP